MLLFLVQTLLLLGSGVVLFRLWRYANPSQRWLHLAVAAGFAGRAVLGTILFWISYLRLPIARSLQLGGGFWVFAQDATWFFPEAARVAGDGVRAIVMYDRGASSVMYEQLLSTFIYLFGGSVAVGVLINLFCYLGTVAILVRWSEAQPRTATAAALAIAGITFSPAFVLWSLQPLKDPFFQLLFVAFVASCAAWQRAWTTPGRWRARIGHAVLLIVLLFALAGIRWYFAAVLIAAAAIFMLMTAVQVPGRRLVAFAEAAVVVFLLSQSLAVSAAPYLPERLRALLNPRTTIAAMRSAPATLAGSVESARAGFEHTAASTMIHTGDRLKTKTAPAAAVPPPAVQVVTVVKVAPKTPAPPPVQVAAAAVVPPPAPQSQLQSQPQPQPPPMTSQAVATPTTNAAPAPASTAQELSPADDADIRALLEAFVSAWNRHDFDGFMTWWLESPNFVFKHGDSVIHGSAQTSQFLTSLYGKTAPAPKVAASDVRVSGSDGTATVNAAWTVTPPSTPSYTGQLELGLRRVAEGWKIERIHLPAMAPIAAAAAPARPAPKPKHAKAVAPTPAPVVAAAPAAPPAPAFTDADAAQVRALLAEQAAAWDAKSLPRYIDTFAPDAELADGANVVRGRQPLLAYFKQSYSGEGRGLGTLSFSSVNIVGAANGETASISGNCRMLNADGEGRGGDFAMQMRRAAGIWKVTRMSVPVQPTVAVESQPRIVRLAAGSAALLLPRTLGEWLGLVRVSGGRGMLWFAEIDTLVFDAVLLIAVLALATRRAPASWRNPLTWLVLLTTVLIFAPLAYTIGNFGTLFRLREMIYVGLLLVPLAAAARVEETHSTQTGSLSARPS